MKRFGMVFFFCILFFDAIAGTPDEVHRLMKNSENWSPKQYTANLKQIEKIGVSAVPTLLELLSTAEHQYAIGHLCEALGRVPSAVSIPKMESFLTHPEWIVRSNCGASVARIHAQVQSSEASLSNIFTVMKNDKTCIVRKNIAIELSGTRSPRVKIWSLKMLEKDAPRGCDTSVALYALTAFPVEDQIGQIMVSILEDTGNPIMIREHAAYALTQYHYAPAKPALRNILSQKKPEGNIVPHCLTALGEIGDSSDIELIQKVMAKDPYDGEGIWSVNGREAIQKIKNSEP